MPSSTLFKLNKQAIEEISSHLDRLIHDYKLDPNRKHTPSKYLQDKTGLRRDVLNSLKRRDDEWRTRKIIDRVAQELSSEPHEIVLIVKEGLDLISPNEYFQVTETPEIIEQKIAEKLSNADVTDRHFIEAIIFLLQEPEFALSKPRLVSLPTGNYGIRKIELGLSNADIIELSKARPRSGVKKGIGLISSSGSGVVNAAYMQKLDLSITQGDEMQIPLSILYDLAFALNVLPSSLITPNTQGYSAFAKSESEIARKLTNA